MTRQPETTPEAITAAASWLSAHRWLARLLLVAAGVLQVLAHAPFALWPLAIVALTLLFVIVALAPARHAFGHGWSYGLGLFGLGVSWVYHSIHLFGDAIAPVAGLLTAGFVALLAVLPAILAWLLRRCFPEPRPWQVGLVWPTGWVLLEWVRWWLGGGFPWLLLGQAVPDTLLGGWLPMGGPLLAGWVLALVAGQLARLLLQPGRWQVPLIVLAAVAAVSMVLKRVEWVQPTGRSLQVALVQGNVPQARKWLPEEREPTLARYRRLTLQHLDSDLVVWPETAIPAYLRSVEMSYLQPLAEATRGTPVLVGVFTYDYERQGPYNTLLRIDAPYEQAYYKRHLVVFGEYYPLRDLLGLFRGLLDIPMSDVLEGTRRPLLSVDGIEVGPSICFEVTFPDELADSLPEAGVLVNVSNDAWFGDSLAPHQHLQIARSSAAALGRPLLRATNTGITAIVGPRGELLARAPQFERTVLTGRVQPMQGLTPYARWRNGPVVLIAAIVLVWACVRGKLTIASDSKV